jgi:hypothetical protein
VLLITSAGLFVVGVAVERSVEQGEHRSEAGAEGSRESGEEGESEHKDDGATEGSERLFGIEVESPALVALAVALSVALGLTVLRPWRWPLFGAVIFGLLFLIADVREVVHQVRESRPGIVLLATVLGILHLAVAGVAWAALTRERTSATAST